MAASNWSKRRSLCSCRAVRTGKLSSAEISMTIFGQPRRSIARLNADGTPEAPVTAQEPRGDCQSHRRPVLMVPPWPEESLRSAGQIRPEPRESAGAIAAPLRSSAIKSLAYFDRRGRWCCRGLPATDGCVNEALCGV